MYRSDGQTTIDPYSSRSPHIVDMANNTSVLNNSDTNFANSTTTHSVFGIGKQFSIALFISHDNEYEKQVNINCYHMFACSIRRTISLCAILLNFLFYQIVFCILISVLLNETKMKNYTCSIIYRWVPGWNIVLPNLQTEYL